MHTVLRGGAPGEPPARWNAARRFPEPRREYEIDCCAHHLFERWAARRPEAIAVLDGRRRLTYAELNGRANRIAHCLLARGVEAGDFVGLFVEPGLRMLAAVLGIYKAGGVYVPLDPEWPAERLQYLMSDARPGIVVTDAARLDSLPAEPGVALCLDRNAEEIAACPEENPARALDLEQTAYLNYTSGSTGKPKGVMGYHRGLANYLVGWGRHAGVKPNDRFMIRASFAYGAFHRQFLAPLVWGASTVLASREERWNPVRLMEAVKHQGVTILDFMPTAWRTANHVLERLPAEQRRDLLANSVRLIIAHGEILTADIVEKWRQLNESSRAVILNNCGGTETSCITTSYRVPDGEVMSPVPIGRPVCNASVHLLDERLQPVPAGAVGEICYGGPNVTRGYLNQPELTAQKFISDPYSDDPKARLFRSGDLARYLPDGNLQQLKRNDLQVKLRGYRVELEEVEAVLNRHESVERVVVDVREDAAGDQLLVAYVLPSVHGGRGEELIKELRRLARDLLPGYMVPGRFVFLDKLPLTSSGKLDRRGLPEPPVQRQEGAAPMATGDGLETELIDIWETILDFRPIGIRDNFFDLGGTSIRAVYLYSEIEARLGWDLPLSSLLANPTISALARAIRDGRILDPDSSLITMKAGVGKPPLFLMPHGGLHALCYRELAERLDPGRPVYALEPKGVDGRLKGDVTVDEQAGTYLAAIRGRQPHGPYFLGGLSGGGLVAWEIAQRLTAAGEEVKLVALFDAYAHSCLTLKPPFQRFAAVLGWYLRARSAACGARIEAPIATLAGSLRTRGYAGTMRRIGQLLRRRMGSAVEHRPDIEHWNQEAADLRAENRELKRLYRERTYADRLDEANQLRGLARGPAAWLDDAAMFLLKRSNKFFARVYAGGYYVAGLESLPEWKRRLVHEHVNVWRSYRPAVYDGDVVLFRAMQEPPGVVLDRFLGWREIAMGRLDVVDVPGTHTEIIQSPVLASRLQDFLDQG